ncbi:MAG: hypothetical protein GF409_07055 [Candidatus Omnitrophica bacterium]|nr:hypothetical protein [Candidatus Omnitrophota bacterium]
MKEKGTVIKKEKDQAVIEIQSDEACSKCCSCGGAHPRRLTVSGQEAEKLATGQKVMVEMEEAMMLKIYAMVYGLPLAVFVVTVIIIHYLTSSPGISFSLALAATVLAYLLAGALIRREKGFSPTVTALE